MLVVVYAITGLYGPAFWDKGFLTVLGLEGTQIPQIPLSIEVPNVPLNICFMLFGAFGLLFNIFTR